MKHLAPLAETERHFTAADEEAGIGFADISRMLGRHKLLILLSTLVCGLVATLYVFHETPVYEALATVRIDPSRAGTFGFNEPGAPSQADGGDSLHTETAILRSDSVAIRTLQSLSPEQLREYTKQSAQGATAFPQSTSPLTPGQEQIVGRFKARTSVKQEESTQLVDVTFRDKDPQLAAAIVNKLVQAYMVQSFTSRDQSVAQLQGWLSTQMEDLRKRVVSSQATLASFQQANNIIATPDASNTTTDRLKLLNEALTTSQAARIGKEAQYHAAQTGDPAALASLFPNPKMQALQTEQATLYAHSVELSTKFGPKYAPLMEVQRQLNIVNNEIATQTEAIREQLRQEYQSSLKNQEMLQSEYDVQKNQAFAFNRNQAEYAVLQGQVTSARELFDTLQRKLQQAGVDAQINGVNTTIVDSARAPLTPIEPKKTLTIASGLILGVLLGIAGAFLMETNSDHVQSLVQLERLLPFRVLAVLYTEFDPKKSQRTLGGGSELALALPGSLSPVRSEGYRSLRANLLAAGDGVQTILLTSPLADEGLQEALTSLAISMARTGSRVLVIDADLRHPTLHTAFGVRNDLGLGNYLSGLDRNRQLLQPISAVPNLCLLVAGEQPAFPGEALSSAHFRSMIDHWKKNFDYILVRTAPLLAVSDALPLLSWFDATVLLLTFDRVSASQMTRARSVLQQCRARVAGLIIDKVPQDRQHATSYGKEGFYA